MTKSKFRITLARAAELIQNYVEEFELGKDHPKVPKLLGGVIKKDLLEKKIKEKNGQIYQGLAAWFCWDPAVDGDPKNANFFLAFEINDAMRRVHDDLPDETTLARPFELYKYDKDRDADIMKMLTINDGDQCQERHMGPLDDTIERGFGSQYESGTVIKLKEHFRHSGPRHKTGPYNQFVFGLFENRESSDVDDFLGQPGLKYIKYYFGYDKEKDINKIRVILFATDENRCNLVPDAKDTPTDDDCIILQKSWP